MTSFEGDLNPSTLGLNFLHRGGQWAFELGIGWLDVQAEDRDEEEEDRDGVSAAVAGDVDIKCPFSKGAFIPFVQLGLGIGAGGRIGENGGVELGAGGGFAGLGLFAGSKRFYGYG